jgi:hypothetical protein
MENYLTGNSRIETGRLGDHLSQCHFVLCGTSVNNSCATAKLPEHSLYGAETWTFQKTDHK